MAAIDDDAVVETPRFQATLTAFCAAQLIFAAYAIYEGAYFISLYVSIQVVGMYRRLRWGHRMLTCALWFMMMIGVGLMLPARLDGINTQVKEPPTVMVAGLQALLTITIALTGLHFNQRYRKYFHAKWF